MLDRFKFILFFILLFGMILILYFFNHEKDMLSFYNEQDIELDFNGKKTISDDKMVFLDQIIRASQYSNYQIVQDRNELDKTTTSFSKSGVVTKYQLSKLKKIMLKYGIEKELESSDTELIATVLDDLVYRVQVVPVRLALAQAILESAWGESRFAKEGNSYFGIHCYTEGCGMSFGNSDTKEFVKTYDSMQASVEDYMLFLNTKNGPKKFRNERYLYFSSEEPNINDLARSLDSYSEIGGKYQKILSDLFNNYIPEHIEDY